MNIFIFSIIPFLIYLVLKQKKPLHMLQQNTYDKDSRYLRWIGRNFSKVFFSQELLGLVLIIITYLTNQSALPVLFAIIYGIFFFVLKKHLKKEQVKLPLVITARVKRLIVTLLIIYIAVLAPIMINYNESNILAYYLILNTVAYLSYLIIYISNKLNIPAEKIVFLNFKRKAQNKLSQYIDLKIIGVTGSYGKTSSKNILNSILSEKYNSIASPQSFNTPYGLIRTVNEYLNKFHNSFIAEMGAKRKGEIKQLCDLVKPKYGILTKIGPAHLESFGSMEIIQNTKFELIESLPNDGIGILNMDDKYQTEYKLKNKVKILWVSLENKKADVYASNIKLSHEGTEFKIHIGSEAIKVKTVLLGDHNIYNILQAVALAKELGLTIEQIERAIIKIKPITHRLELKTIGSINIIDDAFNSNPDGAKSALKVLNQMPGKKIIITPGMIELGEKQFDLNKKFGKQIAEVCDEVILVGHKQTIPIQEGLKEAKYKEKNIHIIDDVKKAIKKAQELKDKTTYVLIENDLPDLFNE